MQRRGADWLAAYALGVVFSEVDDERCVQQVLEAATGDVQALEAARGRVLGVEVGDDVTRRRASRVLEIAAARLHRA